YQTPKVPHFGAALPPTVRQVHSDAYRNPQELIPGAALVVGSAQSGAQIAEELYLAGKKVYLAVGRAGRTPRRYRGKDANWWSEKLGLYDRSVDQLPSPRAKFAGKPHISGDDGRTYAQPASIRARWRHVAWSPARSRRRQTRNGARPVGQPCKR